MLSNYIILHVIWLSKRQGIQANNNCFVCNFMDINQSTGIWFYTYYGHFTLHLNKNFIILHGNQYVSSFWFSSVNKKDLKELFWFFLWEMVNEVAWLKAWIYIFNSEFKSKSSCSEQLNSPEDFPHFWAAERREIPMASSTVWLSCSRTEPFYSQVCKSWVLCNHSIFNSGLRDTAFPPMGYGREGAS